MLDLMSYSPVHILTWSLTEYTGIYESVDAVTLACLYVRALAPDCEDRLISCMFNGRINTGLPCCLLIVTSANDEG